jgi:DNA-binding protein HU-beta
MARKATTPTTAPIAKARASAKPASKVATKGQVVSARGKKKDVPPPPPPAPTVITLRQLADEVGEKHELPPRQARAVMNDVVALLVEHLKAGDKLRLKGLGVLEVKNRPARTARNPATGAAVQVAASKKIAFRPAKDLKEAI